ncbi:hypothetical protein Hoch_3927 [Haliangium ochraceum DSM 14365]|uniref:Uncharacterized protein n=2 Tax=Haliangium ochraceum TaxID=80816 RepID=D0LI47_HALO1|nr:hypothetical protein Hoch_3927 [Haliangium ochraceum DSM 14365]
MTNHPVLDALSRVSLSSAAEQMLGLTIDLERNRALPMVELGLWWILPLAPTLLGNALGLALLPGAPLDAAPVVFFEPAMAATAAPELGTALPLLVYQIKLAGLPGEWPKFEAGWPEVAQEADEFAAALGDAGGFDRLLKVAKRRDWIAADDRWGGTPHAAREQACGAILSELAPVESHRAFRAWLTQTVQETSAPATDLECFGPWRRQAEIVEFFSLLGSQQRERRRAAAWRVLVGPANLDTSRTTRPSHLSVLTPEATAGTTRTAADALVRHLDALPDEMREHPAFVAAMTAHREGDSYDGLAHARAAAQLAESGRPVEAYYALMSASFWSWLRLGEGFAPAAQAARRLAEDNGWTAIAEHLAALGVEAAD